MGLLAAFEDHPPSTSRSAARGISEEKNFKKSAGDVSGAFGDTLVPCKYIL